jgi:hypothetical protein
MILCFEMFIFSVVFLFVYGFTPYLTTRLSHPHYQGGPLGIFAIVTAFNPVFVMRDMFGGF